MNIMFSLVPLDSAPSSAPAAALVSVAMPGPVGVTVTSASVNIWGWLSDDTKELGKVWHKEEHHWKHCYSQAGAYLVQESSL